MMRRRLSQLADAELVALARAHPRRRDAFEELARRHLSFLHDYCFRICMDADMAADCAQEAMVRAWLRMGELRDDHRFVAWLRRIATRLCLDGLRRRRREEALHAGLVAPEPGMSPDEHLLLRQALASLSAEDRALVVLRADGARWREVADALGLSESAARMRGSRLLKRMATMLDASR